MTTTVFMMITLRKLHVIAQKVQGQQWNRWLAILQLTSTIIWAGCWFGIFAAPVIYDNNYSDYHYFMLITSLDFVSIDAIAINFCIMALILYRSSKVATYKHQ